MHALACLLHRLGLSVLEFVAVLILTVLVSRVIPGNAAALYAGTRPRPQRVAAIKMKLGLDKPLPEQFLVYVSDLLYGDFGESYDSHRSVSTDLRIFRLPRLSWH